MKLKAALVVEYERPLTLEEVELQDEPKADEALV